MRILIAGKNSYVGTRIRDRLTRAHACDVTEIDLISDAWSQVPDLFHDVDAVVHVAAIVHRPAGAVPWAEYHRANTRLPLEVARRARRAGVCHFVFLSTMGVYQAEKSLPEPFVIDAQTPLGADNYYALSKLEAENLLSSMQSPSFRVSIIRPPSVYGEGCPGNYLRRFVQLADRLPVFPDAFRQSRQGFLHVENLAELVFQILAAGMPGCFMPQDDEGISTVELIRLVAAARGRKIHLSKSLGQALLPLHNIPLIKKLYGGIVYHPSIINSGNLNYHVINFDTGMRQAALSF